MDEHGKSVEPMLHSNPSFERQRVPSRGLSVDKNTENLALNQRICRGNLLNLNSTSIRILLTLPGTKMCLLTLYFASLAEV